MMGGVRNSYLPSEKVRSVRSTTIASVHLLGWEILPYTTPDPAPQDLPIVSHQ